MYKTPVRPLKRVFAARSECSHANSGAPGCLQAVSSQLTFTINIIVTMASVTTTTNGSEKTHVALGCGRGSLSLRPLRPYRNAPRRARPKGIGEDACAAWVPRTARSDAGGADSTIPRPRRRSRGPGASRPPTRSCRRSGASPSTGTSRWAATTRPSFSSRTTLYDGGRSSAWSPRSPFYATADLANVMPLCPSPLDSVSRS